MSSIDTQDAPTAGTFIPAEYDKRLMIAAGRSSLELGSRIATLLSRLFFGREEIAVTTKQRSNGARRVYQVRSLHHQYRGEEGLHRPASFVESVLRIAQSGGAATLMTVRLRWVGRNCWLAAPLWSWRVGPDAWEGRSALQVGRGCPRRSVGSRFAGHPLEIRSDVTSRVGIRD